MSNRLNRLQPFGQIFGDDEGRRYEQAGKFYGIDDNEWAAPATEKTKPAVDDKAAFDAAVQAAVDEQVAAKVQSAVAAALANKPKPAAK